jgi:hypothetical protein
MEKAALRRKAKRHDAFVAIVMATSNYAAMKMQSRKLRATSFILLFGVTSFLSAQEEPRAPQLKYSNQIVIQCIVKGTANMSAKFKALEQQRTSLSRHRKSIAPIILQQRRLQEEWCAVEAQCVSDVVTSNKELIYGEAFAMCLRETEK